MPNSPIVSGVDQSLPADQDLDFLQNDRNRGIRIQLDYEKTEQALLERQIRHTLVIFGSTRVIERPRAEERLSIIEHQLLKDPTNPTLLKQHSRAKRLLNLSAYYDEARRLAKLVASCASLNPGECLAVMTGGGPGIMEAANRGAFESGVLSIGLNIALPHEQFANPYLTEGLGFGFHYFAMRKLHFLLRACALVAFPGGFGTLDELFEALTLIQTHKMPAIPVILIGKSYWDEALNFQALVDNGTIDECDIGLFKFSESANDAWQLILHWHREHQTPYFSTVAR